MNKLEFTVSLKNFIEDYIQLTKNMDWNFEDNTIDHRTMKIPMNIHGNDPKLFLGFTLSTAFDTQAQTAVSEAILIQFAKRLSTRVLDFIEIIPLQIFGYQMNDFNSGGLVDVHLDSETFDITFTFINPVNFIINASLRLGIPCRIRTEEEIDVNLYKAQFQKIFNHVNYLSFIPTDPIPLFGNNSVQIVYDLFKAEVLSMTEYDLGECIWNFAKTDGTFRNYDVEKLKHLLDALSEITELDSEVFQKCLKTYLSSNRMSEAS